MIIQFNQKNLSLSQGSYSTDNVDLRIAGGPYIYKGFMIKGRVNILGWEIYAHVKLSDVVRGIKGFSSMSFINCWFSHDVIKIPTTKPLILLLFYYNDE